MAKIKKSSKEISKLKQSPFRDYWDKYNYFFLYIGIGLLLIGFILMSQGPWDNILSLSVSPIILLIAYLLIIPLSIFFKIPKKKNKEDNVSSKS